jgi:hypothetical protein
MLDYERYRQQMEDEFYGLKQRRIDLRDGLYILKYWSTFDMTIKCCLKILMNIPKMT